MLKNKTIKNIILQLVVQLVTIISGFIIPQFFIRYYGSEINGLVVSITQFLSYIVLLEAGIGPVVKSILYKYIHEQNKEKIESILITSKKFFNKLAVIFIIYIIILMIVYPFIVNNQFDNIFTLALIPILAISLLLEYFMGMTYKLYIQANQKLYIISYVQIITIILNIIATVILVKLGVEVHITKLVTALIFVARPLVQNIYVRKKYKIDLNKKVYEKIELKERWDALTQHIAYIIHTNTDIMIITIFSTMKEVSVYSIYLLVVNAIKNISKSFMGGIDAKFGKLLAIGDSEKLKSFFNKYLRIYNFLIFTIFLCVIVIINDFIAVYTNGIEDVNYIRINFSLILIIAEFIWAIREPYNEMIKAAGKFKDTKIPAIIEASINIILSIILIQFLGILGVVIATAIAMLIRTISMIYYVSKEISHTNFIKRILELFVYIGIIVGIWWCKNTITTLEYSNYFDIIKENIVWIIISATSSIAVFSIINFKYITKLITRKIRKEE